MDAITQFQQSLSAPVLGFLQQFWFVLALALAAGGYWVFVGNPFTGRSAGGGDFDLPGSGGADSNDDGDSGADGGGDGGGD